MADKTLGELEAEFTELLSRSTSSMADSLRADIDYRTRETGSREKAIKSLLGFNAALEEARKNFKKTEGAINLTINNLRKHIEDMPMEELGDELDKLRKDIKNTVDQHKKSELIKAKADIESQYMQRRASEQFSDSLGKTAGAIASGAAGMFTNAAKKAMSGASGFDIAGGILTDNINTTNSAMQAGANGLSMVGAASMGAGGKIGKLGLAASIAGAGLSMLGNSMSDLAKSGVDFLLRETQKSITNFQLLSKSGASFANGMTTMRENAYESGLTLEQYSKLVSENSAKMAEAGMSSTLSAKELAKVGAVLKGGKLQEQMLLLGYSFEQQAEMSASVMANMNRGQGVNRASAAEVATQTAKYAENLKLVSDLTGEDAKIRAAKVAADNTGLAFESAKLKMLPKQRAQLELAMSKMSAFDQQNFRERWVFGQVINKQGALNEALNSGKAKQNEEFFRLSKAGNLTAIKVAEVQAKYGKEIEKQALGMADTIGKASMVGDDTAKAVAAGAEEDIKISRATSKEALDEVAKNKKATADAEAKAAAEGKKTDTGNIINAQIKSQEAMIRVEQLGAKHLGDFNAVLVKVIDTMEGVVEKGIKAAVSTSASPSTTAAVAAGSVAAAAGAAIAVKTLGGPGAGGAMARAKKLIPGKMTVGGIVGGYVLDKGAEYAKETGHENVSAGLSIASSGLSGASIGAMVGSVVPLVGTAVGAVVGGVLGTGYGIYQEKFSDAVTKFDDMATRGSVIVGSGANAVASAANGVGSGAITPLPSGVKGLLEQVARGEGTDDATAKKHGFKSGYDVSLGYGAYGNKGGKNLTDMTFAEVKKYQQSMLRDPNNKFNSSAVGKYEFVAKTLAEEQKKAGFKDTDKFDAAAQEKMGMQLLKKRGLDKFLSGKMSTKAFQNNMAYEWASIARADTGKSNYGQHTGTSTAQIQSAISGISTSRQGANAVPNDRYATGLSTKNNEYGSTIEEQIKEKQKAEARAEAEKKLQSANTPDPHLEELKRIAAQVSANNDTAKVQAMYAEENARSAARLVRQG